MYFFQFLFSWQPIVKEISFTHATINSRWQLIIQWLIAQLKQKNCFRVLKFVCLIVRRISIEFWHSFISTSVIIVHLAYLPRSIVDSFSDKYSIKKLHAHNRLKGTLSATPSTHSPSSYFTFFKLTLSG